MKERLNDEIKASRVLLISQDGKKLGIFTTDEAKKRAYDENLELMQVSGSGKNDQVVCKMIDYGKYKYKQSQKKKPKQIITKEIRIGYMISDHDLERKNKKAREFINKGYRVNYFLKTRDKKSHGAFRGYGFIKPEEALNKMNRLLESFEDIAKWSKPKPNDRGVSVLLTPK